MPKLYCIFFGDCVAKKCLNVFIFDVDLKTKIIPHIIITHTKWEKSKTDFQITQKNLKLIISIHVHKLLDEILPYLLYFY